MSQKIRILIIATNKWPATGQLLLALMKVGFDIAVICPPGSPIRKIRNLSVQYNYRPRQSQGSIRDAIADWAPSLLICNDDDAVRQLHAIYRQARVDFGNCESAALIELIETSLGDPRSFPVTRSKSGLLSIAQALKIRCPPTIVSNSYEEIDRQVGRIEYPVLIKLDESWGGRGVRLAHDRRELLFAALELSFPPKWPNSLKRLAARITQRLPNRWRVPLPQNISIQHYISGRPANRAVVCWQGKVLAGISVEAIETASPFGPTTLARTIDDGELADAAEKIVTNLKLSGFLGFDFVLDRANRAWLLEMNPRATPTCHLRFRAPSLPATLFSTVTGTHPNDDVRELPLNMIAVFPNRISRQPLHSYFDDAPDGEEEFVEASGRSGFLDKILSKIRKQTVVHKKTRR
jgi:glutathione synthase/RimK-type ligase-like ATP-grasp enzyme